MSKSSSETSANKSPTEAAVSRRMNKFMDTRIENDKDTLDALKQLSTFFKENTLESRRRLRSKIEKRSLAMNEDLLWSFRGVKMTLDYVYSDVMAMNESVKEMTNRLHTTKTHTYQLIDQTTKLQAESQKLCLQQDIVEAFLSRFQLSPAEQAILSGSHEVPITSEFFTVLERVQNIHTNCHTLMQSGHQTAALEIMEQMALYEVPATRNRQPIPHLCYEEMLSVELIGDIPNINKAECGRQISADQEERLKAYLFIAKNEQGSSEDYAVCSNRR